MWGRWRHLVRPSQHGATIRRSCRRVHLRGNMMQQPLLVSSLLEHAARHHPDAKIISRRLEGDVHSYTYSDLHSRARKLANALQRLGIKEGSGERVGTLAVNGFRHLECYFATSGMGVVNHTINPRLFVDHVSWIIQHAEDKVVMFDLVFLPVVKAIHTRCPGVQWVALCDRDKLPQESGVSNLLCYEDLLTAETDDYHWPQLDEETAAALCYTSGTTGNPKGVLYSHRSIVLHSYAACLPDSINLSARDSVMAVVPLYHVLAWGIPYATALVGAQLVLPGVALDGKSLHELIETQKVTVSAGVPTVWLGLLNYVRAEKASFSTMRRTVVGGAACPPSMLRAFMEDFDVNVLHAWGLTEISPIGAASTLKGKHLTLDKEQQYNLLYKQGRAIFGVDIKIMDDQGNDLPWDGKAYGELVVRGPWVMSKYFKSSDDVLHVGSHGVPWFPTGDVATIDPDGFMHIVDRSKDVIKSGGEWISSIELENIALSLPGVGMAAAIGVYHPKWDERPLLIVTCKDTPEGRDLTKDAMFDHYKGKVASWWVPDDVVFTEQLPLGATGKILKKDLRDQYKDYKMPRARRRG